MKLIPETRGAHYIRCLRLYLICLVFFSFFVGFFVFVFSLFVCLFSFSFYYVPPYYSHVEFIVIVWVCLTVFVNVSALYKTNINANSISVNY